MTAQVDLLSFLGQQAIAHAATIFATLTAAYTFASAIKREARSKEQEECASIFFIFTLNVLLAVAIYAALRLIYYGALWGTVLTNCNSFIRCVAASNMTVSTYWNQTTTWTSRNSIYVHIFGFGVLFPSFLLSWALGFVMAVGTASSCSGRGWKTAYDQLSGGFSVLLRWIFLWTLIDYPFLVVLAIVTTYFFGSGSINSVYYTALISIIAAIIAILILIAEWVLKRKNPSKKVVKARPRNPVVSAGAARPSHVRRLRATSRGARGIT